MLPKLSLLIFISLILIIMRSKSIVSSSLELEGLVPCVEKDDCSDLKNATCISGLCSCNHALFVCEEVDYIIVNQIGRGCDNTKNCNINNSECSSNRKCECKSGFVSSNDGRRCLQERRLGQICEESVQCFGVGICRNQTCLCPDNMHENRNICFTNADLGEKCVTDEECSLINGSSCIGLKCACIKSHIGVGSRCLRISQDIDDACEDNLQCIVTLGNGSHCSKWRCNCQNFYRYKIKDKKCLGNIFVGENCTKNTDCLDPGSTSNRLECIAGFCTCPAIYRQEDGFCRDLNLLGSRSGSRTLRYRSLFIIFVLFKFLIK